MSDRMPTVVLDPDGTFPDWMYVIVRASTGIRYHQQFGGTGTKQESLEGFLVPVASAEARRLLDALFVTELRGTGLWGGHRAPDADIVRKVAEAVTLIPYWDAAGDDTRPTPLQLDESRLQDVDEAWLPVVTPDGPGVLVWPNSD